MFNVQSSIALHCSFKKSTTITNSMPAAVRRRSAGIESRNRDTVTKVVEDKLKLKLPRKILEATRASLRVLKLRHPYGSLGKSDSDIKRACALLEYAVRDDHNNNSNNNHIEISMAQLAKAAFMKLKDFREYHEKIGNFRIDAPSTTVTTKKRTARGVTAAAVKMTTTNPKNRRSSNTSSSIVLKKSSIPFLAIQLGAFVPNSSDVAKRAQDYFQDVVEILRKPSNKGGGVHGLRDIQRNQFSYEAACFYLIATSGRDHDSNSNNNNNNSTTTRRRRRSKTGNDDDDDDIERQLDLSTFIDVIKAPSQFQTVLSYVKELREDIESTLSSSRRSSSETETKSTTASRKRSRKEVSDSSEATISGRKSNSHDTSDENPLSALYNEKQSNDFSDNQRRSYSRPNPVFDEWKKKVLVEVCEDAKETMKETKKYELCENDNEAERILDFAVREILAGNGML
jgi:hypothetical protein